MTNDNDVTANIPQALEILPNAMNSSEVWQHIHRRRKNALIPQDLIGRCRYDW